jgi:tRNA(Ile)-lysidine synthase
MDSLAASNFPLYLPPPLLFDALGPFEHAPHLAVALSGGADSTALTLLTERWAKARGGKITALIVDHQLRPESTAEAARVAACISKRGIPAVILTLPHRPTEGTRNLMARAREGRYQALTEWCRTADVLHLCVAHHLDDQAETVALHQQRGATEDGPAGMAALSIRNGVRILRPLLMLTKQQLKDFLSAENMEWVEDPTNQNMKFRRNMLRHTLQDTERKALLSQATETGQARAQRDTAQARAAAQALREIDLDTIILDKAAFFALPQPIAMRLMADALRALCGNATRPRGHETARLYQAMHSPEFRVATLHHCRIEQQGGAFRITRELRAAVHGNTPFLPAKPLAASPFWWLDERTETERLSHAAIC